MSMADDDARAMAERAAAGGIGERLLARLTDAVGAKATVEAVFGEPVRQGDVTIVPVARVRWGVGGGGGRTEAGPNGPASGSGGGGGATADPVGYLVIGPEGARYRRISGIYPSPALLLSAALSVAIVIRALARR